MASNFYARSRRESPKSSMLPRKNGSWEAMLSPVANARSYDAEAVSLPPESSPVQNVALSAKAPPGDRPYGGTPSTRRRVLGDLSNRNWAGGSGEKPFLESRTPRARTGRRRPFEVFLGGENASDPTSVGKARGLRENPAPPMPQKEDSKSFEKDLPHVETFDCSCEEGNFWQPIWEGGPGDPSLLASGLGKAMELADLEAQWLDHCAEFPPFESEEWSGKLTPERRIKDDSFCMPSPPSISPFRMEIDLDMAWGKVLGLGSAADKAPLFLGSPLRSLPTVEEDRRPDQITLDDRWGVWEAKSCDASVHAVRLHLAGEEVQGSFSTREEALAFQLEQLQEKLSWPRQAVNLKPQRSPMWDHPEELELQKQYTFRDVALARQRSGVDDTEGQALTTAQLEAYRDRGFLLGLPILDGDDLASAQEQFDEMVAERTDRAPDAESRFRAAHTLGRPLHQALVQRMANDPKVLAIVQDILGPQFCCWSAHLFCKLPGDPTSQPWHQDAGFWPLSESRAITLWLAFDDVDESNAAVHFIEGSHRYGRLPWKETSASHHLLTQEIPDVDLMGVAVPQRLRAGEASLHSDLTVHGSLGNDSERRRAGLALRFVGCDATCLGAMLNGYKMNSACILPRGKHSDPRGHWKSLKKRSGNERRRRPLQSVDPCSPHGPRCRIIC
ncbi:Phyh [Symbiodinium pilosum]|uniref:Phyh protein n=1 Tax=Symbiodinium pilosum TaxID=2952 RepID=A0A812WJZ2_SYMPI|nr:Phyh [Symbiodinium pilosum]